MKIQLAPNAKDCLIRDFRVGQFFSLLNGLPGRKKWIERDLVFAPTGANIEYLLEKLPEAEWDADASKLRDSYLQLKMVEENTRQDKAENLTDTSGYQHETVPYAHQTKAFLLSRDRESFALFHEQGTGKTKVILDTAAYLFEKGDIDTLLVFAKNGVHINWVVEEIPVHLPQRIPHFAVYFSINWRDAELRNMIEAAKATHQRVLRIITFHIEGVKYLRNGKEGKLQQLALAWLQHSKGCMVVIDESSTIKNPRADRTKFLIKIGKMAKKRRIMTGTPLTSGIENLYSQLLFLDERIIGHTTLTTFRNEFCIMGGFEGKVVTGYKNIEKLIKILDGHSHRVLEKDCLDLPERRWKRRIFEMGTEQRRLYDALRRSAIEELQQLLGEDRGLERAKEIAVVRALRLHQVACGLTPEKNPTLMEWPDPRMTALMEEVEESSAGGRKVIIWARFKPCLREIAKRLGPAAVCYWGEVKEDERIQAVKRLQNDDRIRYFVASSAAAYGLTLTAASRAIYHSQNSSLDIRLQSEKRNHRIGTKEKVLYTDLEAFRSVDGKIINALRKHKELADQINRDPVSLFMEEEQQ